MNYYDLFNRSVCVDLEDNLTQAKPELDSIADTKINSAEPQLISSSTLDENNLKVSKPLRPKSN